MPTARKSGTDPAVAAVEPDASSIPVLPGEDPWTAAELAGPEVPLVVTRTFSKTWSMAAVRLGYLVGPQWVISAVEKVALPYHLDVMTQTAGVLALEHVDEMDRRVSRITEQRGWIEARFGELDVESWPSSANFVLFRPAARKGADVWQRLVDRGVLVRNCASWPGLDGCLRVTVGTPKENRAFIEALTLVLELD